MVLDYKKTNMSENTVKSSSTRSTFICLGVGFGNKILSARSKSSFVKSMLSNEVAKHGFKRIIFLRSANY